MANNNITKTAATIASMYAINSLINAHAKRLSERQNISGKSYSWRYGKVFYREVGKGSPILLIHNLGHRSASYEWDDILHLLAKNNKVYVVDLPGCGRSDKPKFIYTSFLYVQFLKDFCKDIIKEKPSVISSGDSVSFTVIANKMYPELFKKILLINPSEIITGETSTNYFKMAYLRLLFTPIVGTTIYNLENFSYNALRKAPIDKKISKDALSHTLNAYISSHLDNSNGKFLRASKINNYTNINFKKQLRDSNNISILLTNKTLESGKQIQKYTDINPKIKILKLNVSGEFPHMNHPGKVYSEIKSVI